MRGLYYLLMQHEPDFPRLFKVQADFDDTIDRVEANHRQYGRLIASICDLHELKPVDARAWRGSSRKARASPRTAKS